MLFNCSGIIEKTLRVKLLVFFYYDLLSLEDTNPLFFLRKQYCEVMHEAIPRRKLKHADAYLSIVYRKTKTGNLLLLVLWRPDNYNRRALKISIKKYIQISTTTKKYFELHCALLLLLVIASLRLPPNILTNANFYRIHSTFIFSSAILEIHYRSRALMTQ